jgi:Zinc-binding loop region of homing endonuclease
MSQIVIPDSQESLADEDLLLNLPEELGLDSLLGPSLPGTSQGSLWIPPSSSSPASSDINNGLDLRNEVQALKVEEMRALCMGDSTLAMGVLDNYDIVVDGWCKLVKLAPSKENGYVQVSFRGANKFAVLQELVLWASNRYVQPGEDCSHLCHHPKCRVKTHIVPEPSIINQSRKNCLIYISCHHCDKYIFLCQHDPSCIKYAEGYCDSEDFMQHGLCRNLANKV